MDDFYIKIVDNFLDTEDIEMCINYVSNKKSSIYNDVSLSNKIWGKYKKKFIEMNPNFIGLYENITVPFSKKPIRKHKDLNIHNEKFKIVIYLNEVENGGTIFFVGNEKKLIENKKNRLICFDIDLYHESQDFSINKGKVSKLTIGFRPITK